MRLLDRFLLRELMLPMVYTFGGFYLFFVAADLTNEMPRFQKNSMSGLDIIEFYIYRTPELMGTVAPIALLLTTLYALSQHARNNELIAIRTAGVGLWRMGAVYLGVGLFASVLLFVSSEWLEPNANLRADYVLNRRISDDERRTDLQWRKAVSFKNERVDRSWNIGAYNVDTYKMLEVNVDWPDADGQRNKLFARQAFWEDEVWRFENVQMFQSTPADHGIPIQIVTNSIAMPGFNESPGLIASEIKISAMSGLRAAKKVRFSLREILNYFELHPGLTGPKAAELSTQFHGRLAMPWTCLVVVLLALPFGFLPGRRNVVAGFGVAIVLVFAFLFFTRISFALGTGGHVPGFIAGWLPQLLFGGGGFWMLRRLA
ncbi:MAG: lipopolysaccharide export system permease protein [Yoonia sp.]|jgi:lipopolysaccharide export system permease protein